MNFMIPFWGVFDGGNRIGGNAFRRIRRSFGCFGERLLVNISPRHVLQSGNGVDFTHSPNQHLIPFGFKSTEL